MTFISTFYLSTLLIVSSGFLSLFVADFTSIYLILLPALVYWLRSQAPIEAIIRKIPTLLINILTLSAFSYFLFIEFVVEEDLITAALHFTIFLQILKIMTATSNRDFFQIYVLALAHLIGSTLLTADVYFIIPFLLFLVFAPWSFTLFNLKADLELSFDQTKRRERGYLNRFLNSRGIVGWRFFTATAIISLFLLTNTLLVFFLFPRVSFGFLFRKAAPANQETGFSEQVDLNTFGQIKESDRVVMRVEFTDGEPENSELFYWRGLTYDSYSKNGWSRSHIDRSALPINWTTGKLDLIENAENFIDAPSSVEYTIFLESLPTDALFVLDAPIRLMWRKGYVERLLRQTSNQVERYLQIYTDLYGSLYFGGNMLNDRIYTGISKVPPPAYQDNSMNEETRETYLAVPEMSRRFQRLVSELDDGSANNQQKANRVVSYLKENISYSLKVAEHSGDPVDSFLFTSKRGHCELFATSAVLLLRALDVPSRLVSGFRGGDWNNYGNHLAVRERNAHTWIEVYLGRAGWIRLDPTPPDLSAIDFRRMRFEKFRKVIEAIELRWYKYIVNYDLRMQFSALKSLANKSGSSGKAISERFKSNAFLKELIDSLKKERSGRGLANWRTLLFLVVTLSFLAGSIWLLRTLFQLVSGNSQAKQIAQLRSRLLAFYKRLGHEHQKHRTLSQTARQTMLAHPHLAEQIDEITNTYLKLRFRHFNSGVAGRLMTTISQTRTRKQRDAA